MKTKIDKLLDKLNKHSVDNDKEFLECLIELDDRLKVIETYHTSLQGVEPDNSPKKPCRAKRGNLATHTPTDVGEQINKMEEKQMVTKKKPAKTLIKDFDKVIGSGHKAKWSKRKGTWVEGSKK